MRAVGDHRGVARDEDEDLGGVAEAVIAHGEPAHDVGRDVVDEDEPQRQPAEQVEPDVATGRDDGARRRPWPGIGIAVARPNATVRRACTFRRVAQERQHLLDLLGEVLHAIGLGRELHIGLECTLADKRAFEIARREQHLQAGTQLGRLVGERATGDLARHDDVGEQQVDLVVAPSTASASAPLDAETTS